VFYRTLKKMVGIFFHTLNLLMGGNLPPLGSVCLVVEEDQRYLVVERDTSEYVFPGGFMRWQEQPTETARRECKEETGLDFQPGNLIGYQASTSERINTLTVIFAGQVSGGPLRPSMEGKPAWLHEDKLREKLGSTYVEIFDEYLRYRATLPTQSQMEDSTPGSTEV